METISLIYMASGRGKRFGSNKLLTLLHHKPLYQYGLETLHAIGQANHWPLLVVTAYAEIVGWCQERQIEAAWNCQADEGMAASLRIGVQHSPYTDAYAFFPADQPLLRYDSIENFLKGFLHSPYTVGAMSDGIQAMSPAVFAGSYYKELAAQRGDTGGRSILQQHKDELYLYYPNPEELLDIDTTADKARCLRSMPRKPGIHDVQERL